MGILEMTERYFRKNIFLILFILIILSREIYSFSFDGLYIEQGLSYYNYQPIELYGEFRLFYSGNAGRYLHLNGTLGTGYKKWTDHYQVETLVWAMDVEYTPLIGIGLSVGHKLINYSPYVFHSELRQDNFLQGLFVKIDESEKIKLQGFIAMHAEDNTTIPITYSKTNRVYSYDPSQNYPLNIGNIPEQFYNNVWQEHPALWGGALLNLNPIDQISIQEIFLHENYQIDKTGEGYYTYQNDILESSLLFSPSSWFNIKLLYAMMSKNVQAYK